MDVVTHWGAIEADFQRFYNISHPHQEEYKRFLRLLVNMPVEESSFMKIMSNEQLDIAEDGTIIKKQNSSKLTFCLGFLSLLCCLRSAIFAL